MSRDSLFVRDLFPGSCMVPHSKKLTKPSSELHFYLPSTSPPVPNYLIPDCLYQKQENQYGWFLIRRDFASSIG